MAGWMPSREEGVDCGGCCFCWEAVRSLLFASKRSGSTVLSTTVLIVGAIVQKTTVV